MTATRDYLRRADYERAWHDGERLTISDVVGFSIETRTTTTPRLDSDWSRRDQDQKERLAVGITRVHAHQGWAAWRRNPVAAVKNPSTARMPMAANAV